MPTLFGRMGHHPQLLGETGYLEVIPSTTSPVRDLSRLPRALGVATAAYSVAIIVRPELFTKPTALQPTDAPMPTATAVGVAALWGTLCGLGYLAA